MLFRLSFGLLKGQMKEYCDKCQWLLLVSLHEWHYRTKCQPEHAEKLEKSLDWWNVWTAQEDILPGQSVYFHKNSVAINLPFRHSTQNMKIPYSESHKTRTCKTSNKVNLQKLTFTYVVILKSVYVLLQSNLFFCHPDDALLYGSYDYRCI